MKIMVDTYPVNCKECLFGKYYSTSRDEDEDVTYQCKIIGELNDKCEYCRLKNCPLKEI